MSYRGDREMH